MLKGTAAAARPGSRQELVAIARAEVGVKEQRHNRGQRVAAYLHAVGLQAGQPWCAAFVCWVFARAGHAAPRTGWSPALFNAEVNTQAIRPGNVLGIWFPQLHRMAHVGLVEQRQGDWLLSIEGNTNTNGSAEGDGVYRKRRPLKTIHGYADWLPQKGEEP